MRVKPGMSLPKYQKEFDRVLGAVDKYREMMKDPRKPAEQQLEDYHNWVQKIRKAKRIQMEAEIWSVPRSMSRLVDCLEGSVQIISPGLRRCSGSADLRRALQRIYKNFWDFQGVLQISAVKLNANFGICRDL
jgi:hypothetical protein